MDHPGESKLLSSYGLYPGSSIIPQGALNFTQVKIRQRPKRIKLRK